MIPVIAAAAVIYLAAALTLGHIAHPNRINATRPGTAQQDRDAIKEHDMDRIYMNRVPGGERIHIEIAANEVADLLDDLPAEDPEWFDATKKLRAILAQADKDFHHARWNNAATEEQPR